jgi:hypothetical protein
MTPESPCRRVVCANGRMSLVRLFFRRESRRTLGGSGPCRVGNLLGGPREHARPFRFLRALVVSHPRSDGRRRVCRCGCAEVGSSPCFLSGLVAWAGPPLDDRRGGGDSSQPSCGAHRKLFDYGDWQEPPPDIGVREPRRPRPSSGAGSAVLDPPLYATLVLALGWASVLSPEG